MEVFSRLLVQWLKGERYAADPRNAGEVGPAVVEERRRESRVVSDGLGSMRAWHDDPTCDMNRSGMTSAGEDYLELQSIQHGAVRCT